MRERGLFQEDVNEVSPRLASLDFDGKISLRPVSLNER